MKEIQVRRLEIDSKHTEPLRNGQVAFLTDRKCFVYKDDEGKLWYFENDPKLAKALETVHTDPKADAIKKGYTKIRTYSEPPIRAEA